MPFCSSTCHSDSKEFLLLFTSKRFKNNELHNWEYKIFEILLWLKPSWNHGVSMFLQLRLKQVGWASAHMLLDLWHLSCPSKRVWHYCKLVPQPTRSANWKTASNLSVATTALVLSLLPLCCLLHGVFSKSNCTNSQLSFVEPKLSNSHSLGCVPLVLGMPSLHVPCFEFKILTWISTIVWWKSFKYFS